MLAIYVLVYLRILTSTAKSIKVGGYMHKHHLGAKNREAWHSDCAAPLVQRRTLVPRFMLSLDGEDPVNRGRSPIKPITCDADGSKFG